MSKAKQLDRRQLAWVEGLGELEKVNKQQIVRAMSVSVRQTLRDLRSAYSKFNESGGTSNRYTIQRQTGLFKELLKSSEALLGPATIKQLGEIYQSDLDSAYQLGGSASNDLRRIVEGDQYKVKQITKMPVSAQFAAGERLKAFWTKERAELRQKVTEATINALQRGKGWRGAQAQIADALRSSGQTILRSNDELSVTARGGIVMNLEQRADLIAKTEMAAAFVQGQLNQYRKNGYTHGRWSATGERSCPFCASREGAIYRLEDIEGAIPAHPRCRCTVSPVLGEAVDKALAAKDKAVGAAEWLDDAGWTGIRQQRINEYEKFSGKTLDVAKYARTPTNTEKFFKGPEAKAVQPVWYPSGQVTPNVEVANQAAEQVAEEATAKEKRDLEQQQKEAQKAAEAKARRDAEALAEAQEEAQAAVERAEEKLEEAREKASRISKQKRTKKPKP